MPSWLVTEPEAVGVPGWQTGAKAFTVNPHRPLSPSAGHRPGWQQPWWSGMH